MQDHIRWGCRVPVRQGQCRLCQSGTWYVSNDHDWRETSRTLTHFLYFVSDYVQVVDMGTLELRITAAKPGADGKLVKAIFGWHVWKVKSGKLKSNLLHVVWMIERAKVRTALLQRHYSHQNLFGLLCCPHEPDSVCSQLWRLTAPSRTRAQTQQHLTEDQGQQWHQHRLVLQYLTKVTLIWIYFGQVDFPSRVTPQTSFLADIEQQMLQDLMSEAMEETEGQHASGLQQNGEDFTQFQLIGWNASSYTILSISTGAREERCQDLDPPRSDLFLFPDESGNLNQDLSPTYPVLHSPLITPVPNLAQEADDFCILETPGFRREVRTVTVMDSQQRELDYMLSYLSFTGSWSGTSGKAAYFRSCGH